VHERFYRRTDNRRTGDSIVNVNTFAKNGRKVEDETEISEEEWKWNVTSEE